MADQSGHNLKIASSRYGCRFPFERPSVGNGYAASGQCETRQMTPEERARYGPAKPPREGSHMDARIYQACKISESVEEAAELLDMAVVNLKRRLGFMGITPRWAKTREEADDMQIPPFEEHSEDLEGGLPAGMSELSENMPENMPEDMPKAPEMVQAPPAQEAPPTIGPTTIIIRGPKTRLEVAREKLSQEQYQDLKKKLMSDSQIYKKYGIAADVMVQLKREWGIDIKQIIPSRGQKKETVPAAQSVRSIQPAQPDPPREEPMPAQSPAGLTIAAALELRTEMAEDMESLEKILSVAEKGAELTERVVRMLEFQRDMHRQALDRINEAFSRTVVEL